MPNRNFVTDELLEVESDTGNTKTAKHKMQVWLFSDLIAMMDYSLSKVLTAHFIELLDQVHGFGQRRLCNIVFEQTVVNFFHRSVDLMFLVRYAVPN